MMSAEAMAYVLAQKIKSSPAKLVAICIANDFNNAEGVAYPGQKRLASAASMCERQVRQHLKALEDIGFIRRSSRHRSNGSRTSDAYEIVGFMQYLEHSTKFARICCVAENQQPADLGMDNRRVSAGPDPLVEPLDSSSSSKRPSQGEKKKESLPLGEPSTNEQIWIIGRELLPEKKISIIGQWIKRADGDLETLLGILQSCVKAGTGDPISYISAAVNNEFGVPSPRPNTKTWGRDKWEAVTRLAFNEDGSLRPDEHKEFVKGFAKKYGPPPGTKGCHMPEDMITPQLIAVFGAPGSLI